MNKVLYPILLITILFSQDHAGYAGNYLENGINARAIALGNAFSSSSDNQFPAYYNPASTAIVSNKRLQFSHQFLTLDRKQSTIGVSLPLPPIGGISAGWVGSGVSNIQSRDLAGNKGELLSASEDMFIISFGIAPTEKVLIGSSVKLLNNKLPNLDGNIIATGIGFDFGAIVKLRPNINIGLVLKNLNASYSWSNEIDENLNRNYEDKFPLQLRTGIEYTLSNIIILGDYGAYFIGSEYLDSNIRLGLEYVLQQNYFIRGGYRDNKFSFGIGIKQKQFMNSLAFIDYAIVIENVGGLTHVLSYAINF
jgi:hypothetical protein